MLRASTYIEDLLSYLKGDLEPFSYSVRDLIECYGREYEADAAFILRKLEEFAALHGHGLVDILELYLQFTRQVVEEYRLYGRTGRYRYETETSAGPDFGGG